MQGSAEFIPLQRGSLFGVRCLPVVIALLRNKFRAPLACRAVAPDHLNALFTDTPSIGAIG